VAGVAQTGLAFTESAYDSERFEELLAIAGDMLHATAPDTPARDSASTWLASVVNGVPGYVTPKIGIGAFVANDKGELLLIKRSDTHQWLFPTGWADIGYSASEVVVKEVAEECGLDVEPMQLVSVIDSMQSGSRIPHYTIAFRCRLLGGKLRAHPLECEDVGWFSQDKMPEPLYGTGAWVPRAFAAIRGEVKDAFFDLPRQDVWRSLPD